jgi:uridine kinase
MLEIVCVNKGSIKKRYGHGITLREIAEDLDIKLQYPVLGAKVNNQVKSLAYPIYTSRVIEFFDASTISGYTMYERSLSFLLYKAAKDLYPQEEITIKHSISGGKFCEFENPNFVVSEEVVAELENKMK